MPLPFPKPNALHEVHQLDTLVFEKNVDIPLKDGQGLLRGNVYRPKEEGKYPVILTCEFLAPFSQRIHRSPSVDRRTVRQRRPLLRFPRYLIQGDPRRTEILPVGLGDAGTDVLDETRLRRRPGRRAGRRFELWIPRHDERSDE